MSREDTHFRLRLPEAEKAFVREEAKRNSRSMTGEIIQAIRARMQAATGEGLGNRAPAAAQNHVALQGGEIINHGL